MQLRISRKYWSVLLVSLLLFAAPIAALAADGNLSEFDQKVLKWAHQCRDDVVEQMKALARSGQLKTSQFFDTFYIPIANTDPQKYNTQYDKYLDQTIQDILDKYLNKDSRVKFVVAVDRNGYLPTHNSKYARPLTGNAQFDAVQNRTKRLFNDRTGLAAAKNKEPHLIQRYSRDTGEQMTDLSIPLYLDGKHWGAIRIGYSR